MAKETKKLGYFDLLHLRDLSTRLNTPNFLSYQIIKQLISKLDREQDKHNEKIKQFMKEHDLPETERIGPTHPLYPKLTNLLAAIEIKFHDIGIYSTSTEFAEAISGCNFNYQEVDFLKTWLLK